MAELEFELFRFSIQRGPEARKQISAVDVPGDDVPALLQISERVQHVAERFGEADLNAVTVEEFVTALDGAEIIDPEELRTSFLADSRQIADTLRGALRGQARLDRLALSASASRLTAARFLDIQQNLPKTMKLREWIDLNPIQIGDFLPYIWKPRQALVRPPGVADHYVVRDSLLGYQMGEIEDIKNYLKGERKEHRLRYLKVDEEETVAENENETERIEEIATQQRNKVSVATQETANASLGFDARVQTDGQYGPTKVTTDVGFQYATSSSASQQAASEFSSEVVAKSVERVRERELNRITRRRRTELEEVREHLVDNTTGTAHTIGIYRWVESVWKARTYQVGKRLLLEFLIPEPGRAIAPKPAPALPPGLPLEPAALPANLFDTLTASEAARLAMMYGAEGIKAPPLEHQVIGFTFGSAEFKDKPDQHVGGIMVKDVKVPEGFVAQTVIVIATAMNRIDSDGSNVVIDVPGARPATFLDRPNGAQNPFVVSGGPGQVGRPNTDLSTYGLSASVNFGPGASVPVSIYVEDVRGVTGFVELHCRVSDEVLNQWKLNTIQTLTSAYRARLSEWESARLSRAFDLPEAQPDPDLDALCRHVCIASLLGKWPSTAGNSDGEGWPIPGAMANAKGELVLFLEQAFEWSNLQYVLYPHYWADKSRWNTLMGYDHANPKVREFLRSGAARMVVPVPMAMTEAVLFFLDTGLPWFGGGAPIPGQPGYLAIADEIRQARQKGSEDDKLISECEFTLPTALTILQESDQLPAPVP